MSEPYDVVIIGGGPGGYNCAIRAGQLGLKTACVEMRETLGGTCLNVGCIPSKALLHTTELYEAAQTRFAGMGIKADGLSFDLDTIMAGKRDVVDGLTKGIAGLFKKNKVDHIAGKGRIAGKGKVEVDGPDGKTMTLEARNIVIATGSEPTPLPGIEIDEKRIVSSTGALALETVPDHLILVGAGVIGLELGSVWRRLGAKVTVVEYLDRILPGMDSEIAKQAQRVFKKQGFEFKLGRKVTGADTSGKTLSIETEAANGGSPETLTGDVMLVCIGRRPYTEGLGLDTVGIEPDRRGVITNDHFRTGVDGIWVIGDCTSGPMLAHKAEDEGVACAELIAGKPGHVNYAAIPGVVYTAPEIATVGLTEDELKESGRAYKTGKFSFMANSRARANHETDGFVKLLADAETDELLGGHLIGTGVGEMIAELCLALEFGASSEDVARTSHPHPTMTEAIRQAAMGVEGWTMQS